MSAFQGQERESNVLLLLSGTPVTGVAFSAVTVEYKRSGDTAFTAKVLDGTNWSEIGNGYYTIKWSEEEMGSIGPFLFLATGAGFDDIATEFDVEPAPVNTLISQDLCVVSGNIVDMGGDPVGAQEHIITFKKVVGQLVKNSSLLSGNLVSTVPDANGNFSVSLLRDVEMIVEIQLVGLRHKIVVPDQASANLVDLLP